MLRNIAGVATFSLLAQAVGFLRTLVIAALFGASMDLDAYYLALIVPGLFAGIIGGCLQGGFVPVYVRLVASGARERATALRGAISWLLIASLSVLSLLASVTAPVWVHWMAGGGAAALPEAVIYASRIVAFSIVITCLGDFLALVLNCHGRFLLAAAAPVANTFVSVPLLLSVGPTLTGLAVSVVAGAAAQLALVAYGLVHENLAPLPFGHFTKGDLRTVGVLAGPMLPGFAFTQLQLAYIQALPAILGAGAISVFGYASRLQGVAEQVFAIAIGTVLLPHLSELAARGDRTSILKLCVRIAVYALCGGFALVGSIWLIGDWAVHTLLARGRFDAETSAAVTRIWFYLALSAIPFVLSTALSKLIMAIGRPAILSITAGTVMVAVYSLGSFAPKAFGLVGVALVVLLAQFLRLVIYMVQLRSYFVGQDPGEASPVSRS